MRNTGLWRIGLELFALSRGKAQLQSDEYFLQGAWRPGLSWAERRAFVGRHASTRLNRALNPPLAPEAPTPLKDKLLGHALFGTAGLAMPRILAVAAEAAPGPGLRWLDGPAATADFLRDPAILPCFGKPVHGSLGAGAASVLDRDAEGRLVLGNGARVAPEDLAAEIWRDHRQGFMFQELVRPHPELAALIGPVVGSMRLVTLDAGQGPHLLYAVHKAPAAGAMVDSASGPLGALAAIDPDSGRVVRVQDRRQMGGTEAEVHPLTGQRWQGAVLPAFAAGVDLALAAHRCLPAQGLLGVDVFLSDRGPLLTEVNVNPHHSVYQIAFAQGVLNPAFRPRLQAVRARFRATLPRQKGVPL